MEQAIFDTHGNDSELNFRSNQIVEILRPLTEVEADLVETGPMYHIRFMDGYETDAFEDELTKVEDWNGTTPDGYAWETFNAEDSDRWKYKIDGDGNVYYKSCDGTFALWCPASRLSRHIHRLNQIAAR